MICCSGVDVEDEVAINAERLLGEINLTASIRVFPSIMCQKLLEGTIFRTKPSVTSSKSEAQICQYESHLTRKFSRLCLSAIRRVTVALQRLVMVPEALAASREHLSGGWLFFNKKTSLWKASIWEVMLRPAEVLSIYSIFPPRGNEWILC